MNRNDHEEPLTPYEMMLDAAGLDCSRYACWEPAAGVMHGDPLWPEGVPVCQGHITELAAVFEARFGKAEFVPLES